MARTKSQKTPLLLNRTLIIGCGKLGATIANDKWKQGKNVIVIDKDSSSFLHLNKDFSGETIVGNAMDIEKLEESGIKSANEIVIVTGDDNINIFLAYVVCQRFNSNIDIFVRLDDVERGVLLQGLPVKPIYPHELSFNQYKTYKEGDKK